MGVVTCCTCKRMQNMPGQVVIDISQDQNISQYGQGDTKTGTGLNFTQKYYIFHSIKNLPVFP